MRVYMDNAATTQVADEVVRAMAPFFTKKYGNASSLHYAGEEAYEALEGFRKKIAGFIGAKPEEVIFTSGGTESNNLAIFGVAEQEKERNAFATTLIEHPSVLNPMKKLTEKGKKVSLVPVDSEGFVKMEEFEKALTEKTALASVIHANNEIGTIQDLKDLGARCRETGVLFHADSAQAFTKTPIDVRRMNVDLMTLNAHKIHGPKGVGALYVRDGVTLGKIFGGGGQEAGLRAGTENIAGIAGFAAAAEIAMKNYEKYNAFLKSLRDRIIRKSLEIKDTQLNGPKGKNIEKRLSNNANVTFKFVEGEALLLRLNFHGICVSTGSACSARSLTPSHVLMAIGLKHAEAHGSLRFSLSRYNTEKEVDYVVEKTALEVQRLRRITAFKPGMEDAQW